MNEPAGASPDQSGAGGVRSVGTQDKLIGMLPSIKYRYYLASQYQRLTIMTIVSHKYGFVFLKSRKTAGSSVEGWLIPQLGRGDFVATAKENRAAIQFWTTTPHVVTRWNKSELIAKKVLRLFHPELRLEQHAAAVAVRAAIGKLAWENYYKFSIERSPWDRLVSLWKWRMHFFGQMLSFDQFLDLIEHDPENPLVKDWSNLPIYTDGDGKVLADRIIDFEGLSEGLHEVASLLRLPICPNAMPRHKTGHRTAKDAVDCLTTEQTARIAYVCRDEIALFGWISPEKG
jgi:hypothetical protein